MMRFGEGELFQRAKGEKSDLLKEIEEEFPNDRVRQIDTLIERGDDSNLDEVLANIKTILVEQGPDLDPIIKKRYRAMLRQHGIPTASEE